MERRNGREIDITLAQDWPRSLVDLICCKSTGFSAFLDRGLGWAEKPDDGEVGFCQLPLPSNSLFDRQKHGDPESMSVLPSSRGNVLSREPNEGNRQPLASRIDSSTFRTCSRLPRRPNGPPGCPYQQSGWLLHHATSPRPVPVSPASISTCYFKVSMQKAHEPLKGHGSLSF